MVRMAWLLMQERTGSTWVASSIMAQHPQVHMLKGGLGEACFGLFPRSRPTTSASEARSLSEARARAERLCKAQLSSLREECVARGASACGWKSSFGFCPTASCRKWLWSSVRPAVVHLYRRDVVRQAISLALARQSRHWMCDASKPCPVPKHPAGMAEKVMLALRSLSRYHASRCSYMRAFVPRPWRQVAYEDLDSPIPERRRAAIAYIYDAIGVNASWSVWRDRRTRQSLRNETVRSLLGATQYGRLLLLLNRSTNAPGLRALRAELVREGRLRRGSSSWCNPRAHS